METKTKTKNKLLKSALWYGEHDWFVLPNHEPLFDDNGICVGCTCEEWRRQKEAKYICGSPGKHPRLKDWEERATTDPDQIMKWWHRWPTANVGIAAGRSGLVVIDKDTYNEVAEGGDLNLADRETITSLTGGGGEHLIYQHPGEGPPISNSDSRLPEWVNIRSHGGQFIVPPSLHKSGSRYQWEEGFGPQDFLHD